MLFSHSHGAGRRRRHPQGDSMNTPLKRSCLALMLSAALAGPAFAGADNGMDPFTGDSYAYFNGGNIGNLHEGFFEAGAPRAGESTYRVTRLAQAAVTDVRAADRKLAAVLDRGQPTPVFNDMTGG
jgi:hypothetical protein